MTTKPIKHPETAKMATEAFAASGCRYHPEFIAIFQGAIGLRTFRAWLKGEQPAAPIAALMLREYVNGWRPTCFK